MPDAGVDAEDRGDVRADAHIHVFSEGDVVAYEAYRRQFDVELAVVVGYEGSPDHAGNNAAVRRWARTRPWMVPLAYCAPPSPSAAVLEEVLSWAAGISLYVLDGPSAAAVAAWPDDVTAVLRRHQAVVSVNATPSAVAELGPFARATTGAPLLVSHLGLPPRCAEPPSAEAAAAALAPLTALAVHPHVAVKLSGLYALTDPPDAPGNAAARPYIEAVAAAFGPDRLCWGSDFPPCLAHLAFEHTIEAVTAAVPAPALPGVMGANLARILRVDRPAGPGYSK